MSTVHALTSAGKLRPWRPELALLRVHLMSIGYSSPATGRIADYAETEGTLAGCPELDAADEAEAEVVFVREMDAVPSPSPYWGSMRGDESPYREEDDLWELGPGPDPDGTGARWTLRAIPPELDDDDDETVLLNLWEDQHEEAIRQLEVDRIPDAGEPYEPTPEEEADYDRWLREHEPLGEPEAPEDFALVVAPIAGGSPEADRREPTPADLDDYHAAARAAEVLDALRHDDDARAEADRYRGR